jgi:hypothetical protein
MLSPGGYADARVDHILSDQLICAICREPVNLESAKTDDDGNGVHEECYVEKMIRQAAETGKRPTTSDTEKPDEL